MTTANKTTIQGAPAQFELAALKQRQESFKSAYRKTSQSCVLVRGTTPNQFLQVVINKANEGFTLSDYPTNFTPLNYSILMKKPEHLQAIDLLQIDSNIKAKYIAELELNHATYKANLLQQLIETEEAKQAKKAEAARDKMMVELQRQVDACYTPLVFPEE